MAQTIPPKKGVRLMSFGSITEIIVQVIAGIILHYFLKWLDKNDK
jgi:hypothetical protein